MLKKYKNNGIIYLNKGDSSLDKDIKYNTIYIKNYSKYKDVKSLDEILNITKKEYYTNMGCLY